MFIFTFPGSTAGSTGSSTGSTGYTGFNERSNICSTGSLFMVLLFVLVFGFASGFASRIGGSSSEYSARLRAAVIGLGFLRFRFGFALTSIGGSTASDPRV